MADIWNLIKTFALQKSIFKGKFIGLRAQDGKVLSLSEFKAFIDNVDESEDLTFFIVKERFENTFSAIESRITFLSEQQFLYY